MEINTKIIRSNRKTLGLEIKNAELIVRAPLRCSERRIRQFVTEHALWIERQLKKAQISSERAKAAGKLTDEDIKGLKTQAKQVIPERVRLYAKIAGVTYGTISIRCQATRWGSCSAKGNLSFNCLLMLAPKEVLDSVIVHELCHIKYMNHSRDFYKELLRIYPMYYKCNKWLKEHGEELLMRRNK